MLPHLFSFCNIKAPQSFQRIDQLVQQDYVTSPLNAPKITSQKLMLNQVAHLSIFSCNKRIIYFKELNYMVHLEVSLAFLMPFFCIFSHVSYTTQT